MAAGLEIHEAASTGDFDSLEEYLRSGKIDVNLKDDEWGNRSALHWACAKGYVECIRLLLDHGANGTIRSDSAWTPAHFAAETGKLTALRALFNAHIPIGLKDKYGDTPRRVAEIYGQLECVKFLEQCEEEQGEAGYKRRMMSSRLSSAARAKRSSSVSSRFSIFSLSMSPSVGMMSRSSSPITPSSPCSPISFVRSAEDEQSERGINNDSDPPTDQEARET